MRRVWESKKKQSWCVWCVFGAAVCVGSVRQPIVALKSWEERDEKMQFVVSKTTTMLSLRGGAALLLLLLLLQPAHVVVAAQQHHDDHDDGVGADSGPKEVRYVLPRCMVM